MNAFVNAIRAVSKACGVAAALLVASAIVVVCQMVVMRYVLKASTIWQTEYVIFALVGATLIGSPYVLMIKGHVNVDLLPMYLGKRARLALAYLSAFAGLAFSGLLAWSGYELFAEALRGGWRTDTVWSLPLWIPYLSLPVGVGLLALQYVADILSLATGRQMPFEAEPESAAWGGEP